MNESQTGKDRQIARQTDRQRDRKAETDRERERRAEIGFAAQVCALSPRVTYYTDNDMRSLEPGAGAGA